MTDLDENLLTIDLNNLEEDCAEQPKLMAQWSKCLADARKEVKDAKNALKLAAAELSLKIRRSPEDFGIDKATEAAVEAVILTNRDYQIHQENLVGAEYNEDVLDGFVKAIVDRKSELQNETQLHGQTYWSKPHVSTRQQDREAAQKQANVAGKGKKK
jgi:hypothetical protein